MIDSVNKDVILIDNKTFYACAWHCSHIVQLPLVVYSTVESTLTVL